MTEASAPRPDAADQELLMAIADQRDPEALAKLYDEYAGLAYGLSMRIVTDPGLAEDTVQDAFFSIWRNARGYSRERGTVRNWILSVVRNRSIDRLRQHRVKQRLDTQLELVADTLQRPGVWTEVSADLERERISQALTVLPADQRKTIELAYFGGYSHSEIANLLHIPLGTVKGRLRLGMDKLRSILAEPGGLGLMPE